MRYTARVLAGLMITAGIALPAQADEDKFTVADVLAWDRKSQDWYFEVTIGTAGVIASNNKSPASKCINDWHFLSEEQRALHNDEIRQVMDEYTDYHPGIVVLAVVERECGTLNSLE